MHRNGVFDDNNCQIIDSVQDILNKNCGSHQVLWLATLPAFYDNVRHITKMTTLGDRKKVKTNARTLNAH